MARKPRILHVIERLAPGGAATALVETARRLAQSGQSHEILSLESPVAATADEAAHAGLRVIDAQSIAAALPAGVGDAFGPLIEKADLVWVHAWTSPVLDAFLRRAHPPARWLFWLHVAGDTVPHVLTPALAGFPDALVASTPYTASIAAFADTAGTGEVVLAGGDLSRFAALPLDRQRRPALGIGYVGTLDGTKLHPDFVSLSAAARIPAARFEIYGRGTDEDRLCRQIDAMGDGRFVLHGWTRNVPAALSAMDIFGYPLVRDCHATAELVVQEAMAAGLAPVLLDHGAAPYLVEHGRTGLIARGEDDYPRCLERLAGDEALRRDLGHAARRHALAHFGADRAARAFASILDRLLARPKRMPTWPDRSTTGADRFIAALGGFAGPFLASRTKTADDAARAADRRIEACSPALASATSGGVLHWRRFYPADPWLRFWSGLVLLGQGRRVPALGEFLRALALGIAPARLDRYIDGQGLAIARPDE